MAARVETGAKGGHVGDALVDQIAREIRERIMTGQITIGAQLRQAELAAELGVSRTPVREALRKLQTSGLIEVLPNRGAVVRVPAPWEVREAYEVRAELEGLACARATDRLNDDDLERLREANRGMREAIAHPELTEPGAEPPTVVLNDVFHTTIHQVSGNQRLMYAIAELNEAFPRNVSFLVLAGDRRRREENVDEHERIVEALADRDAQLAREQMRKHVIFAGEQLARWYERRSSTIFNG